MIYIFHKMLMFKMLNINACIFCVYVCVCVGGGGGKYKCMHFWCVCVCVLGGGGIAFIMSLQLLINSVWKCRLI